MIASLESGKNLLPPLPAVKLPDTEIRPTVIIDSRERESLPITRLPVIRAGLTSGDYSFVGGQELFAVERKSIPDLVACCMGDNRDRFERELHRLRGFRFARLLIVGDRAEIELKHYRSTISPVSVLHTLAAFEARYIPIVWARDAKEAARLVEYWTWWFARELIKSAEMVIKSE